MCTKLYIVLEMKYIRDQAMELAQPISALAGGARHFSRGVEGGAEHFSSWMLNDELNLTVLEKGGRHFFKVKGGGGKAKLKPETDTPELRFKDSIAWSLIWSN